MGQKESKRAKKIISTNPLHVNTCEEVTLFYNLISQEWFSSSEAATYLRVSRSELMNLCSSGEIPYYKLGRRNRYRRDDLNELLLRNRRGGFK